MPRWLTTILILAASVTAFAALLAIWVDRQVLNTDNWTAASSRMLEDPAIRSQTAAFLADRAYEDGDLEARIGAVLPPRAQPLAAPAASSSSTSAHSATSSIPCAPARTWRSPSRTR